MLALQSSSGLGSALFTILLLALLAGLVGALGSAAVRRLSNPVGKYRLLYALVLAPVTLGAYWFVVRAGFGATVAAWFGLESGLVAEVVGNVAEFLAAGVVWLTAYAPTILGVRDARDIDLPASRALRTMARYVVGVSAVLALVLTPVTASSVTSPPVLIVGVVATGVVLLYGSPWLIPLVRTTTQPTDELGARIDDLRERAGLEVRDVRLLDDGMETAETSVRGPPGYRRLFLTATFVEQFDDDVAAALLAVEAAHLDRHLAEIRVGTVVIAGATLVASVTGVGPLWPTLGGAVLAVLVGFALSRRAVRAADDDAVGRVGSDSLATALERYAAVHGMEPTRRRVPNPLSTNVALGDRIDRLRERGAADPTD
jgi:STE24 endopeptidase